MVDVGVRQLRCSRDRLDAGAGRAAAEGDQATAGLLLFYAAECGLKAEMLASVVKKRDTAGLPSEWRTHDLRVLAKALRLPVSVTRALARCRRRGVSHWVGNNGGNNGDRYVECRELHEAWRYGADLDHEDEKAVLAALSVLVTECRKRG